MNPEGRKRLWFGLGALVVFGACCLCSGLYLAWIYGDQVVRAILN